MLAEIFGSPPAAFLLELILKGTAVLAIAGVLVRIAHNASASYRHAIWAASLVVLALLPLGVLFAPEFRLPAPSFGVSEAPLPTMVQASEDPAPAFVRGHTPAFSDRGTAASESGTLSAATPSGSDTSRLGGYLRLAILATWALGVLAFLLINARARLRIAMITRFGSTPAESREQKLVAKGSRVLGLSRRPEVRVTHWTTLPVTWGILRPVLLLPPSVEFWSDARMRVAIHHELAHVRRRDYLWQAAADLATALQWLNPLAWFARRAMRREQERACDDQVLEQGTSSPEYAEHLVEIARAVGSRRGGRVVGPHRQSELGLRIQGLLEPAYSRTRLTSVPAWGMAAIALLLGLGISGATFAPPPTTPQNTQELWALTTDKSPEALDVLLTQLEDPDPERRGLAALSLGERRDDEARRPLIAALSDPDPFVRENAAVALVGFGGSEAIRAVVRLTGDSVTSVRSVSTWVLGELGSEVALRALLALIDVESDAHTRSMAVAAVTRITDQDFVPHLVSRLATPDETLRLDLVHALGMSAEPAVVPVLTEIIVRDESPMVRGTAIRALGEIDDPGRLDAWLAAMADSTWQVRNQSLLQLATLEEPRAHDAVIEALRDSQHQVRLNAAWALERMRR